MVRVLIHFLVGEAHAGIHPLNDKWDETLAIGALVRRNWIELQFDRLFAWVIDLYLRGFLASLQLFLFWQCFRKLWRCPTIHFQLDQMTLFALSCFSLAEIIRNKDSIWTIQTKLFMICTFRTDWMEQDSLRFE